MPDGLKHGLRPLQWAKTQIRRLRAAPSISPMLRAWGAGYRLERPLEGQMNSTWSVTKGSEHFVLRQAGGAYEVDVLQRLAGKLAPYRSPEPLPLADGSSVFLGHQGKVWVLYPRIPGATLPKQKTTALVERLGHLVATVSRSLRDVPLVGFEGNTSLRLFDSSFEVPVARGSPQLRERMQEVVGSAIAWGRRPYEVASERLSSLPKQTIYNDYHDNNILAQSGRIVGLLDFDSLAHGPALVGLQNALIYVLIEPAHREEDYIRALLGGYASVVPLTCSEREIVPALMVDRLLWMVSRICAEDPLRDHRAELAAQFLDLVQWITCSEIQLIEGLKS